MTEDHNLRYSKSRNNIKATNNQVYPCPYDDIYGVCVTVSHYACKQELTSRTNFTRTDVPLKLTSITPSSPPFK